MTMRSMPPASSHFADRPVPGAAADDRDALLDHSGEPLEDRRRARSSCPIDLVERTHRRRGELAHR